MTVPATREGLTPGAQRAAALRVRQCALTREELPVDSLLRFVLGPGGAIAPDLANKLGGRGIWITATRTALDQAIARNVFAKSLKKNVKIEKNLVDFVEAQLTERLRQSLSFAAKAGLVTTGFVKVEVAMEAGKVAVLVQSRDAADDGVEKLRRKFQAIAAAIDRPANYSRHFTGDELSMALGRTNVVHAGLAEGGQTSAFLRESLRLERFRLHDEIRIIETESAPIPDDASGKPSGLNTDRA